MMVVVGVVNHVCHRTLNNVIVHAKTGVWRLCYFRVDKRIR